MWKIKDSTFVIFSTFGTLPFERFAAKEDTLFPE
jgi:hypothetical protein